MSSTTTRSAAAGAPPRRGGVSFRRPGPTDPAPSDEVLRLTAALQASAYEIAALERALAAARAENERLRARSLAVDAVAPAGDEPRAFHIRRMLLDQHSRNP